MKKIVSIISSLVLAAGMTVPFAVNAAGEDYKPEFYFKAEENKGVEILKYGSVFINSSNADADTSGIPVAVYIKDEQKLAGQVFVKWSCENKDLKLKDLSGPVTKYGHSPYSRFNADVADDSDTEHTAPNLSTNESMNLQAVNYSTNSTNPMALSGEKSDSYPLAWFKASLANGAKGGNYDIKFYSQGDYTCRVVPRFEDKSIIMGVDPAEYSEGIRINISNRKLGDVNNDTFVDAVDASSILAAYAKSSANEDSGLTGDQAACADVDGNKLIDAVDASNVLAYYAYLSSEGGSLTLNEFIKSK